VPSTWQTVGGDVDVDQCAAIVAEDDESKEQAEGEGRDHEEIDGDDLAEMRLKAFLRTIPSVGYARRRDLWAYPFVSR